jgi:hypothetical protein
LSDESAQRLCAVFAEGLAAFHARRWREAGEVFSRLRGAYPQDGPARFYGILCEQYAVHPPGADWSGMIAIP